MMGMFFLRETNSIERKMEMLYWKRKYFYVRVKVPVKGKMQIKLWLGDEKCD